MMHQSRPTMAHTLDYNNRKVLRGKGQVLHVNGIRDRKVDTIEETFKYRERASVRKLKTVSFHMSINPSETDDMSTEQVIALAQDIMEQMGYGGQPWVLYQHDDIERRHYHVVSIRVNDKGRKVRDYYEKKKCLNIVDDLQEKYGFVRGKEKHEGDNQTQNGGANASKKKVKNSLRKKENIQVLQKDNTLQIGITQQSGGIAGLLNIVQIVDESNRPKGLKKPKQKKEVEYHLNLPWVTKKKEEVFVRGQSNIKGTINAAIDNCLSYHFTTEGQFAMLMESHCVKTTLTMRKEEQMQFEFRGVDGNGNGCTRLLDEESLGRQVYQSVKMSMEENISKKDNKSYKNNRYYLKNIISQAVVKSQSINELLKDMATKGIDIKFFINKESSVSGVTVIDHNRRTIYKCSEIDRKLARNLKKLYEKDFKAQSGSVQKPPLSQAIDNAVQTKIENTKPIQNTGKLTNR